LLKQSRLAHQPEKADSWDDTSGYSACGHECVVEEQQETTEQAAISGPQPGDVIFHQHDFPGVTYYLPEDEILGVWSAHSDMKPHKHEDGQVIPL
jgi:hypothetical protein